MPDSTDSETAILNSSFEKGAPHRDTHFRLLMERSKMNITKEIEEAMLVKDKIKVQLASLLQFYKLIENKELEYEQSSVKSSTSVVEITKASRSSVIDEFLNQLEASMLVEKMHGSGWKI